MQVAVQLELCTVQSSPPADSTSVRWQYYPSFTSPHSPHHRLSSHFQPIVQLVQMFSQLFCRLLLVDSRIDNSAYYVYLILSALAVAWLSWRIWAFTIKPAFRPEEPRVLPYWIPGTNSIRSSL